jgi:hypothetical protein
MAFARISGSGMTVTAEATLTLYQIDTWSSPKITPVWYAEAEGPGGSAKGEFFVEYISLHDMPPHSHTYLWARAAAFTPPSPLVWVNSDTKVAEYTIQPNPPPPTETWTVLQNSIAWDWVSSIGTLYLYKARYDLLPNDDLVAPCHPNHMCVCYAWGSHPDTHTQTSTMGGATDSTAGLDMVAHIDFDAGPPITPIEASGTCDLAPIVLTLGISADPGKTLSGVIAEWTGISYNANDLSWPVDLDFVVERNGLKWTGAGSTFTLEVTDWESIAVDELTVTIYPPTVCTFDLSAYNWNTAMSAEWTIPDALGTGTEDVAGGITSRVWNKSNQDDPARARIWSVAPYLAGAWATTADEATSDLPCTIEERGLTLPTDEKGAWVDWLWSHFPIRRKPSTSFQLPWDAGGTLPSSWDAQDAAVTVSQVGIDTTITVDTTATNSCSAAGSAAYGAPQCYQRSIHLADSDVWCWEQWQFLKVSYTSDKAATLTLRIDYDLDTVWDDHESGAGRVLTYSTASLYMTRTLTVAAGANVAWIDLQAPTEQSLRHVRAVTISGFVGDTADWEFTLNDIELHEWNPQDSTEAGRYDTKVVFPRPDAQSGLPISYTGMTSTADGLRCIRPPDQMVTLCDEHGFDFCEYLRSGGDILDHLWNIGYWFRGLADQEGIEVDFDPADDPAVWEPGEATCYDPYFIDADANDMLEGYLTVGDVVETMDKLLITSDASYTALPVRIRVGRVYLAACFNPYCVVEKRVHGQVHGVLRTPSGARAGAANPVQLYELDGAFETLVGSQDTDDWSRYYFATGGHEKFPLVVTTDELPPSTSAPGSHTANQQVYNELRTWIDAYLTCPCKAVSIIPCLNGDTAWRAFEGSGSVWVQRSADGGRTWGMLYEAGTGISPSLTRDQAGRVILSWQGTDSGSIVQKIRVVNAVGGSELILRTGRTCPSIHVGRRGAYIYVVDLSETAPYDVQFAQAVYQAGTWTTSTALAVTVDTGVDAVTPSVTELPNGSIAVCYSKTNTTTVKVSTDLGTTWT